MKFIATITNVRNENLFISVATAYLSYNMSQITSIIAKYITMHTATSLKSTVFKMVIIAVFLFEIR